jgi:hypothetical protein
MMFVRRTRSGCESISSSAWLFFYFIFNPITSSMHNSARERSSGGSGRFPNEAACVTYRPCRITVFQALRLRHCPRRALRVSKSYHPLNSTPGVINLYIKLWIKNHAVSASGVPFSPFERWMRIQQRVAH